MNYRCCNNPFIYTCSTSCNKYNNRKKWICKYSKPGPLMKTCCPQTQFLQNCCYSYPPLHQQTCCSSPQQQPQLVDDEENFIESVLPFIRGLPKLKKMELKILLQNLIYDELRLQENEETCINWPPYVPSKPICVQDEDELFFWQLIPQIKSLTPEKRLSIRLQFFDVLHTLYKYGQAESLEEEEQRLKDRQKRIEDETLRKIKLQEKRERRRKQAEAEQQRVIENIEKEAELRLVQRNMIEAEENARKVNQERIRQDALEELEAQAEIERENAEMNRKKDEYKREAENKKRIINAKLKIAKETRDMQEKQYEREREKKKRLKEMRENTEQAKMLYKEEMRKEEEDFNRELQELQPHYSEINNHGRASATPSSKVSSKTSASANKSISSLDEDSDNEDGGVSLGSLSLKPSRALDNVLTSPSRSSRKAHFADSDYDDFNAKPYTSISGAAIPNASIPVTNSNSGGGEKPTDASLIIPYKNFSATSGSSYVSIPPIVTPARASSQQSQRPQSQIINNNTSNML